MGKAEDIFEEKWAELLEMYREDWKYNLKDREKKEKKDQKTALKYLPEHFYSEGDVEAIFSCMLRDKLSRETHYNSEYVVRNQLRFAPGNYEGFEISDKIAKMRKYLGKAKVGKKSFVPDIVIDSLSGANDGSFLIFAELTYQPGSKKRYNEGIPRRIYDLIEKAKEEAKTLTAAIDAGVCISGYVCIISDDLVSIDGAMDLMENLEKSYPEVNFLSGGMTLKEKYRILGKS